jgi:dihydrodipicolinate synthase/N-acetylneuraminate lyase
MGQLSQSTVERQRLTGIWSATPTPFTENLKVDTKATKRMVDRHLRLGVKGLLLAGTCGEGPWMTEGEKRVLIETAAESARGKMVLAVQVTDNSAGRVLDNIASARRAGADIAMVAPPYFLLNATPENVLRFYQKVIQESPMPVGIYNLGRHAAVKVPESVLAKILLEKNVVMSKDSSSEPSHRGTMLAARRKKPELVLLSGDEFNCVEYLSAGYDGLLLGGAIVSADIVRKISDAVAAGDLNTATRLEQHMTQILYKIYGGKSIQCWLSGLKWTLVQLGVFQSWKNFLDYPLTSSCTRDIKHVLKNHADELVPWEAAQNGSGRKKLKAKG